MNVEEQGKHPGPQFARAMPFVVEQVANLLVPTSGFVRSFASDRESGPVASYVDRLDLAAVAVEQPQHTLDDKLSNPLFESRAKERWRSWNSR